MKRVLSIGFLIAAVATFGLRIQKGIQFKQNVSGYLERAANASTVALAHNELTRSLGYLEANGLTEGYTSIVYETPDEDIGFWYQNLKAAQQELAELPPSASALERTNVLLKLRETLLDEGGKANVIVPEGLSVYPNNLLWAVLIQVALWGSFGYLMYWAVEYDKREKAKAAAAAAS